ncbi:MAG: DUF4402 domain-containing protein [Micavibrio sp.]
MTENKKKPMIDKPLARTGAAVVMVALSSVAMVKAIAATATLPVMAKLIRAVEVTINTSLDFGTLAFTNEQVGQARIDPATGTLTTDGANSLIVAGGKPKAGRILIRGSEFPVQVSMEQAAIQLSNGEMFVTIEDFNFINATAGSRVTITPNLTANTITLPIGATLKTNIGQLSGTYVGSNRVFANYQ